MSNKLNMQDLIDLLTTHSSLAKDDAEIFVEELFQLIDEGLAQEELVKVKDFGTFKLTPIAERESVDVNSGDKIVIPAHRRVSFLPSQGLKNLVNKPFAHFETTQLNEDIFLENVEHEAPEDNVEHEEEKEEFREENSIESNSAVTMKPYNQHISHSDSTEPPILEKADLANIESRGYEKSTNHNGIEEKSDAQVATPPNKEKPKKTTVKRKQKHPFVRIYIFTALIVIAAIIVVNNFYKGEKNPIKKEVPESEIPKSVQEIAPTIEETISPPPPTPVEEHVETVTMTTGRTLRLIALDRYGSREFWVYIYLKNQNKIKNPDVIPVGIELVLPHKTEYPMNAENPQDVAKAKKLGDEEMKKFW